MAQYKIVRPETTVKSIRKEVENQSVFPVVDVNGQYQGYIQAGDLVGKPDDQTAEQILDDIRSKERNKYARLVFVNESDPLDEGLKLMGDRGLPFMPVVDRGFHYTGTIDAGSVRYLRR